MEPAQREKFTGVISRVLTHAPLIVIVVSSTDPAARIPAWEQDLSAGAVCMNLLHAAHALGFAGTWLTDWAAYSGGGRRLLGMGQILNAIEQKGIAAERMQFGEGRVKPPQLHRADGPICIRPVRWLHAGRRLDQQRIVQLLP